MLALARTAAAARTDWSVQVWSADVLGSRNLNGITQTPDGFLWAATPGSLFRFDGARFMEFSPEVFAGSPGGRVAMLTHSRDGSLWVAMNGGRVFKLNGAATERLLVGSPDQTPSGLVEDGNGDMWFTLKGAVGRIRDGKVTPYQISTEPDAGPCALARDKTGRIWIAHDRSVGVIRDDHFQVLTRVPGNNQVRLATARAGGIWIGAGSRLYHFAEASALVRVATATAEGQNVRISTVLEDRTGALWVGTSEIGLMRYTAAGLEKIPTSYRRINHLFEDNEGNIWVGTGGGGLDRIRLQPMVVEGAATGVPFESLCSLCEDDHGGLWAATHDGQLVSRMDDQWSVVTGPNVPRAVTCVAADHAGIVWIGTRSRKIYSLCNGVFTMRGETEGIASRTAKQILVSATKEIWIIGSTPGSVQSLRDGKLRTWALPNDAIEPVRIAEDAAGQIWVGTNDGALLRVAGDHLVEEPSFVPRGPRRSISSLYATADGALWIGYDRNGLGRVKNGRYANLRIEQGLYDDDIRLICDDGRGWLWLGSQRGIFKVRQSAVEDVIAGRAPRLQWVRYTADEGLPQLLAARSEPSEALRSRDGRLWFPMGTALTVVRPDRACDVGTASPVRVTQIKLDGHPWAVERKPLPHAPGEVFDVADGKANLRVPPSHRKLELEFACLSFSAPENVNFRYRLVGFDEGWIEGGAQHGAAYPRLPAGDYRFEVMACNSSGVWNETPATLAFAVAPFFWQTWWFQAAALIAFTVAVTWTVRIVSYRRLHRKVKSLEQQAAIERERARIARDIHDDVGNRLTRILLLSGRAQSENEEPAKTAEHLRQICQSATEVTDSLDEIVWAVNPRNDTLPHLIDYVGKFAIEFLRTAGIESDVDLPERPPERSVPADVRHNFFLGIKEALNNVVRHAGATKATVRVTLDPVEMRAIVADNGCGFAAAPDSPTADGLRNLHARMTEIGGRCEIESTPGAGTRVTFIFRWSR